MAKDSEVKSHLTSELVSNKRAPVWIYLRTKRRELIRGRRRNWRTQKLKLSCRMAKMGKKVKRKKKRY
jgi:ribosomal protein L39E